MTVKTIEKITPSQAKSRRDLIKCAQFDATILHKLGSISHQTFQSRIYNHGQSIKSVIDMCIILKIDPMKIKDWEDKKQIRDMIQENLDAARSYADFINPNGGNNGK